MRRGEKWVLGLIAATVVVLMSWNAWKQTQSSKTDHRIPFYSTATPELAHAGSEIYREQRCKRCHSLWAVRDMMQAVPAPALDGIGSLRDEEWLFGYLSAPDPQSILPSRLKPEYRMPSFADLPAEDRHTLAAYLASLKVEDWYLDESRKAECRKLTGKEC